jgi:hypothetical protein
MGAAEHEVEPSRKICSKPACSKAGELQPLSDFYLHAGCADGHRPECKGCSNKYHANWARPRYIPKRGCRLDMSPEAKLKRATLKAARDERRVARLRRRNEASVQLTT